MRRGANFPRRGGDVDVGELLELVVHARKLLDDVLPGARQLALDPGDIEKDAPMRAATAFANLAEDASSDVIPGKQLRRAAGALVSLGIAPSLFLIVCGLASVVLRNVVEHEPLALTIQQNTPLAS